MLKATKTIILVIALALSPLPSEGASAQERGVLRTVVPQFEQDVLNRLDAIEGMLLDLQGAIEAQGKGTACGGDVIGEVWQAPGRRTRVKWDYAACVSGCFRSHDYCRKHQAGEIDCDHQLGQCLEFCEQEFEPELARGGVMALQKGIGRPGVHLR